jgi:hypothetical protein
LVHGGQLIDGGRTQLELCQAIPVPDEDVPLAEVLEFKRRRDPEFVALRSEIDGIAANLNGSNDIEQSLRAQIDRIDKACLNVIRVGSEWQFPVRLVNIRASYELKPVDLAWSAALGALGQEILLPGTSGLLGTLLGAGYALRSMMKVTFDGFQWKGLRPRLGPYRYVYSFHKELF